MQYDIDIDIKLILSFFFGFLVLFFRFSEKLRTEPIESSKLGSILILGTIVDNYNIII